MNDASVIALKNYFETLTQESVANLGEYYSRDACFKDPFNEVRGIEEIQRVFRHMFATLDAPAFVIQEFWLKDRSAVFLWEFRFFFRGKKPSPQQHFTGMSLLRFDDAGQVNHHRDYWDAAEEIYEKFPLIGSTLRWIKRQMN